MYQPTITSNNVLLSFEILCLVQQNPLFNVFLANNSLYFSLVPSIPFLFQKQKTKKGVEIVPVAMKYWQTVSPRKSMHLGLLFHRKGSFGLTASVRWATHPVNQRKQRDLFKTQSSVLPSASKNKAPSPQPFKHKVLTYLLTYLLTPWSRVLLEKLTG